MTDLKRIAFTIDSKNKDDNEYALELVGARGPKGPLTVVASWVMSGANPVGTEIDQAISGSYDLIGLRLRRLSETSKAEQRKFGISHIRVGNLALTDDYTLTDGFTEIFNRFGDVPEVYTFGRNTLKQNPAPNMLPFDVARASLGEIADELAIIGPWFWRRQLSQSEVAQGLAGEFGTIRWKVVDPHTPIRVLPVSRFNAVAFDFNFGAGYTLQKTVVAAPNPFDPGIRKTFNLDWEDPPRESIATIFAQSVANYLASDRFSGRGIIHNVSEVYEDLVIATATAYWQFDETATVAADSSDNSIDGVYVNLPDRLNPPLPNYDPGFSVSFVPQGATVQGWNFVAQQGGGGGVNTIAISPHQSGAVVIGGDISGPQYSTDSGHSWVPSRTGLADASDYFRICAVLWDKQPAKATRVWMGSKTGLWVSNDSGASWALATNAVSFDQFLTANVRPRTVGHLIDEDAVANFLYFGSVSGQLYRYQIGADPGTSGTLVSGVNVGSEITSVYLDPNLDSRLWVGTRLSGLVRVDGVKTGGTGTWTVTNPVGTSTNRPSPVVDEAVAIDEGGTTVVYCACKTQGVRRYNGTTSNTWSDIHGSLQVTGTALYGSLAAYRSGGQTTVALGCSKPATYSNSYESVAICDDASVASPVWQVVTGRDTDGDLSNEDGGPGGPPWWGYLDTLHGGNDVNALFNFGLTSLISAYTAEQLAFDPRDTHRLLAAGQAGVFYFDRNAKKWYPMMRGLGLTTNNDIAVDPNDNTRVFMSNNDHTFFGTVDGGVTWMKNEKLTNQPAVDKQGGFSIAFDRPGNGPSRVWMAFGDQDVNMGGEVYWHDNPIGAVPANGAAPNGYSWRSMGFAAKNVGGTTTDAAGNPTNASKVIGLAVKRVGAVTTVIALTDGFGVWRSQWSTARTPQLITDWAQQDPTKAFMKTVSTTSRPHVDVEFQNSTDAYAFDRETGIWRTTDLGVTWTRIWSTPRGGDGEGFLAVDPQITGRVFVSVSNDAHTDQGVWRLDNAQTGTVEGAQITKTELHKPTATSFVDPGPISAISSSRVFVAEQNVLPPAAGTSPKLWRSQDAGATDFREITDPVWAANGYKLRSMVVGEDQRIWTAHSGPGQFTGTPFDLETLNEGSAASYVSVPDNTLIRPGLNSFSLECWIKRSVRPQNIEYIISKGDGAVAGYELKVLATGVAQTTIGAVVLTGTSSVCDGVPHHIVATFSRLGLGTLYVDGVAQVSLSIASESGRDLSDPMELNIGRKADGTLVVINGFSGAVDEVSYHASVIPAVEVLRRYNAGLATDSFSSANVFPGDNLILANQNYTEVTVGECGHSEDGLLLDAAFTSGNPLLDKWLESRQRHLNQGLSNEASTLGALDVQSPKPPTNLTIAFDPSETKHGETKHAAELNWDPVLEDIDGSGTAIEIYHAQIKPFLDAAMTIPVTDAHGGGWRQKTVRAPKDADDPNTATPTRCLFNDLENPKTWYWTAMVRAEDFLGQLSDWAGPVTPAQRPADFGPAQPTGVDVYVAQHTIHVDWTSADALLEDLTATDITAGVPAEPQIASDSAYFRVKIFRDGLAFDEVRRVYGTHLTHHIKKPADHTFTAQVQAVDQYGNVSLWGTSSVRGGPFPPVPQNAPGLTIDGDEGGANPARAIVNFNYASERLSYPDDDINHFVVQLQWSNDNSFGTGNVGHLYTHRVDDDDDSASAFGRLTSGYWVRGHFRAVDRGGRKSPWSPWSTHRQVN